MLDLLRIDQSETDPVSHSFCVHRRGKEEEFARKFSSLTGLN